MHSILPGCLRILTLASAIIIILHTLPSSFQGLILLKNIWRHAFLDPVSYAVASQKDEITQLVSQCTQAQPQTTFEPPDLHVFDSILMNQQEDRLAFMLETSNTSEVTVRQACALESAAQFSGRTVILLVTGKQLILTEKMRRVLQLPRMLVARVNFELLLNGTPLERMFSDGRYSRGCCKTVHTSDILRLAVLYRYGGWYTDLDTVTTAATKTLQRTVGIAGDFVANGNMIFPSQSRFLRRLMVRADQRYTGKGWNSLGPALLTETIIEECNLTRNSASSLVGRHRSCGNITVLSSTAFYPFKANERAELFRSRDDQFWTNKFQRSFSVHFFGQITSGRNGWVTGNRTAYDFLGPRYCPKAYSLQGNMDLYPKDAKIQDSPH